MGYPQPKGATPEEVRVLADLDRLASLRHSPDHREPLERAIDLVVRLIEQRSAGHMAGYGEMFDE